MTTYEPGTVAVATVRGVKDVRVWKMASGTSWATDRVVHGPPGSWRDIVGDEVVTDVRPLVVLDLDAMYDGCAMGGWDYVIRTLRDQRAKAIVTREDIADQIEAQTKPPRIPEPGQWGVVEAKHKRGDVFSRQFVRKYDKGNGGYDWQSLHIADDTLSIRWDDLIDPTLIREGLS